MKKLFILLMLLPLLSGCWNYRELDDISIVTGFALDKTEDGFMVSAQVMDTKKMASEKSSGGSSFIVMSEEGRTFFEALRKITLQSPKKLYISHVEIMIIDEELARSGIKNYIDFMVRDHEFRTEFNLLISKDSKAREILETLVPLDEHSAHRIAFSLESSSKVFGATKLMTFDEFISELLEEGKQPTVSGVILEGSADDGKKDANIEQTNPESIVYLDAISVFKEDRLVGWLTEDESVGFNLIMGNIKSIILNIACDEENYIGIETIKMEAELNTTLIDNKPVGEIKIDVLGAIGEVNCKLDLNDSLVVDGIRENTKKYIKDLVETTLYKSQVTYNSDIFGFGEALHKSDYKYWDNVMETWDDIYKELEIDIEINFDMPRHGVIDFVERE